jgi:hypothetical protein
MTYSSWGATLAAPNLMVAKGEVVALAAIARAVAVTVAIVVAAGKVGQLPELQGASAVGELEGETEGLKMRKRQLGVEEEKGKRRTAEFTRGPAREK